MKKSEADRIILECKKQKIEATMQNILDDYTITFGKKLKINNFKAAKLIVNALVIEGRDKRTLKKSTKEEEFKPYPPIRKMKSDSDKTPWHLRGH